MELMYWWLAALVLIGIGIAGIIIRRARTTHAITAKPIANSWRIRQLPRYQLLIRRYQLLLRGLLTVSGIGLLGCLLLVGRLSSVSITTPESKNRDIMLCLDISGSMEETDVAITRLYAEAAKSFTNERIGMVVFNSSPAVVFPLTNDYNYVIERLTMVSEALANPYTNNSSYDYWDVVAGTMENTGSSLIGDGLASCVNRFDQADSKRSRSIILGTDNYVAGEPIVTLQEAAGFAAKQDIRVYGINPTSLSYDDTLTPEAADYKKAMLATKGDYYQIKDPSLVPSIIAKISAQDATRFKGSPEIIQSDIPAVPIVAVLVSVSLLMVAAWRLRL